MKMPFPKIRFRGNLDSLWHMPWVLEPLNLGGPVSTPAHFNPGGTRPLPSSRGRFLPSSNVSGTSKPLRGFVGRGGAQPSRRRSVRPKVYVHHHRACGVILVLVVLLVLVQQRISWSGGAVVITRRMDKHAKRFARDAGALEHEREDEHEHGEDHNADGGDERSDGGEPTSDIVVKESEVELELGVIVEVDEDEDEGSEVRGAGVTYS